MRNNADILNELLLKYKLVSYIPEDIQLRISKTMKSTLLGLYRSQRRYSRIYILVIALFLMMRKIGFKLSIFQAKILFTVSSAVIISSGGAAGYFAVKYAVKIYEAKQILHLQTDESFVIGNSNTLQMKTIPQNSSADIRFRIGVQPFRVSGVVEDINGLIVGSLTDVLGKRHIIDLRSVNDKNVNLMLMGSITRIGGNYILSYKLVDVKTSMVLLVESEKMDDVNRIDFACRTMAEKIKEHIQSY